jgi:hypothetical protein
MYEFTKDEIAFMNEMLQERALDGINETVANMRFKIKVKRYLIRDIKSEKL